MFALGDGWDDFTRAWIADGAQDCGIYRAPSSSRDLFFGATLGDGVFQAKHPRMRGGAVLFSCSVESGTLGVVPVEAIAPETRIGASHHFESFAAPVVCRWRAPASGRRDQSVSNPFVHFCEFWIGQDIYLQAKYE